MVASSTVFRHQALSGSCPQDLSGVSRDSRLVVAGQAYVATGRADEQDAHVAQARAAGATVVVSELSASGTAEQGWLISPHARWSFAYASAQGHGLVGPGRPLLAVVGTAGKSTTTHCAWWALGGAARRVARIGTIGWHDGDKEWENPQTTPPPEQLHRFLAGLPQDCPAVVMELSSHAGDQHRAAGLAFAGMVFTGLGHDHLDYHRTTASYLTAKLRLLRLLAPGAPCVINADDAQACVVAHAARAAGGRVVLLGHTRGDWRLVRRAPGWSLCQGSTQLHLPMRIPGDFNAWNAAGAALLAGAAGVSLASACARLADLPAVPGRLELLAGTPDTYVDYAHTPDEISTMLRALRREFPGRRLVCVFGCGGDRDRSKRAPMGCAALSADLAVLTTDNSRSEDPRAIAQDVVAGLPPGTLVQWAGSEVPATAAAAPRVLIEPDRARAIRQARASAGAAGIVVVAGKGHETTQSIQGRVTPWDDRAFVRALGVSP